MHLHLPTLNCFCHLTVELTDALDISASSLMKLLGCVFALDQLRWECVACPMLTLESMRVASSEWDTEFAEHFAHSKHETHSLINAMYISKYLCHPLIGAGRSVHVRRCTNINDVPVRWCAGAVGICGGIELRNKLITSPNELHSFLLMGCTIDVNGDDGRNEFMQIHWETIMFYMNNLIKFEYCEKFVGFTAHLLLLKALNLSQTCSVHHSRCCRSENIVAHK